MALTRKFLASKGIEADVIDEIITAHTDTISGLKDELDTAKSYKEKAEKYDTVKAELDTLRETVAKNSDKDYVKLKKEFDDYKDGVEKKEARSAKEAAFKTILNDIGIPEKHHDKIVKYSDIDALELDANGKISTAKDLAKSLKEEWGDHIQKSQQQGAQTATPPNNTGNGKMTKEEIMKIKDSAERQKAIVENHELFGF